ncbi:MAG: hypothetical protein VYD19_11345 [Myxococcota bacterium]|nr:hypothetical protein [Myxococcota bacterium]
MTYQSRKTSLRGALWLCLGSLFILLGSVLFHLPQLIAPQKCALRVPSQFSLRKIREEVELGRGWEGQLLNLFVKAGQYSTGERELLWVLHALLIETDDQDLSLEKLEAVDANGAQDFHQLWARRLAGIWRGGDRSKEQPPPPGGVSDLRWLHEALLGIEAALLGSEEAGLQALKRSTTLEPSAPLTQRWAIHLSLKSLSLLEAGSTAYRLLVRDVLERLHQLPTDLVEGAQLMTLSTLASTSERSLKLKSALKEEEYELERAWLLERLAADAENNQKPQEARTFLEQHRQLSLPLLYRSLPFYRHGLKHLDVESTRRFLVTLKSQNGPGIDRLRARLSLLEGRPLQALTSIARLPQAQQGGLLLKSYWLKGDWAALLQTAQGQSSTENEQSFESQLAEASARLMLGGDYAANGQRIWQNLHARPHLTDQERVTLIEREGWIAFLRGTPGEGLSAGQRLFMQAKEEAGQSILLQFRSSLLLCHLYERLHYLQVSRDHCTRALYFNPSHQGLQLSIAHLDEQLGNEARAFQRLGKQPVAHLSTRAARQLARLSAYLEPTAQAQTRINQLLTSGRLNSPSDRRYIQSILLHVVGRPKEAFFSLKNQLQSPPVGLRGELLSTLGRLLSAEGRSADAQTVFAQASGENWAPATRQLILLRAINRSAGEDREAELLKQLRALELQLPASEQSALALSLWRAKDLQGLRRLHLQENENPWALIAYAGLLQERGESEAFNEIKLSLERLSNVSGLCGDVARYLMGWLDFQRGSLRSASERLQPLVQASFGLLRPIAQQIAR